jgi:serine/threonine protein kinase
MKDKKYKLLIDGKEEEFWKLYESLAFTKETKDLIMKMLSYDPNDRIKQNSIMEHEWFQNGSILTQEQVQNKINSLRKEKSKKK